MKKKRDNRAKLEDRRRQKSAKEAKIHTLIDELRTELAKAATQQPAGLFEVMKAQDEIKITGT
jgi:hypothetical protein